MNKLLQTTPNLIQHMKNKGITFNIISETNALHFLQEHNYYFKIAAYRKNYNTITLGPNTGKYIGLDFAYLKDLSIIDCNLRYLILQMCLDFEHSLKILLLQDIENNTSEDGYKIVSLWFQQNSAHLNKIQTHLKTSYCRDLINKYNPSYPVWVLLELLSFGELCKFIDFYNKIYPKRLPFDVKMLFPIRDLRNAAAHNNCLIHDVRSKYGHKPNPTILKFLQQKTNISQRIRKAKIANKPLHDFICLLYLYPIIVKSEPLKSLRRKNLRQLIKHRMRKHEEYYLKNAALNTTYQFVLKIFQTLQKQY